RMNALSPITEAIAASISPLMVWYCSPRSARGTGMITSLLPAQAPRRIRRRDCRLTQPAGSRASTEPPEARRVAQRHRLPGLDRLVERGDQFETLAALQPVHQRGALASQTFDHMPVIG